MKVDRSEVDAAASKYANREETGAGVLIGTKPYFPKAGLTKAFKAGADFILGVFFTEGTTPALALADLDGLTEADVENIVRERFGPYADKKRYTGVIAGILEALRARREKPATAVEVCATCNAPQMVLGSGQHACDEEMHNMVAALLDLSEEDKQLLHYNPNTSDLVVFVQQRIFQAYTAGLNQAASVVRAYGDAQPPEFNAASAAILDFSSKTEASFAINFKKP